MAVDTSNAHSANSNGSASVRIVLLTSSSTSKTSESHTMSCCTGHGVVKPPLDAVLRLGTYSQASPQAIISHLPTIVSPSHCQ